MDRLILFIKEGEIHTQKIKKALNKLPKTIRNIEEYEETLDSLAFRFSRLQGLLGEKIFKEYLNFALRDTEKGRLFNYENLGIRRPGNGLKPIEIEKIFSSYIHFYFSFCKGSIFYAKRWQNS